jgi:hypothetical protein
MDGWMDGEIKKETPWGVCVCTVLYPRYLAGKKIGNSLQGICPRASNETFLKYTRNHVYMTETFYSKRMLKRLASTLNPNCWNKRRSPRTSLTE